MYAGKSTELIRRAHRHRRAKKKVLCVKHKSDTRYSENKEITTHEGQSMDCITVGTIKDLDSIVQKYDVICVDEGQFFSDIMSCVDYADKFDVHWIIAALNGDINRHAFGDIGKLEPMSDQVDKISAICHRCANDAYFTSLIVLENDTGDVSDGSFVKVGGDETYKASCRKCYNAILREQL